MTENGDNTSKIEKPDFMNEGFAYADLIDKRGTSYWSGLSTGFKDGQSTIWNSHVLPLLSQLQEMREWRTEAEAKLIEAGKAIGLQSNEIDSLREENERLKARVREFEAMGVEYITVNPEKQSELSSLKKENEELKKGLEMSLGMTNYIDSRLENNVKNIVKKIESLLKP